jgi:predicted ester cyclase
METERNKATLQRLYDEVMNGHDVDAADELITPDRPGHDATFPAEFTTGREGFKRLFRMLIAAFPDLRFTTDFMVAEGDLVTAFRAHTGASSWGFRRPRRRSPSTTPTRAGLVNDSGLICEHWGVVDIAAMMRQLGVSGA